MSSERREVVGDGGSSGKSTPNWSRMDEGGGAERGSTGKCVTVELTQYIVVGCFPQYTIIYWA